MLKEEVVRRVKELLATGKFTQRKIARMVGINRNTVNRIARGRRPDFESIRRAKRRAKQFRRCQPKRCPGCGYKIFIEPCMICHARNYASNKTPSPADNTLQEEPSLALNLDVDQRQRYDEVHDRKVREGEEPVDEAQALRKFYKIFFEVESANELDS